MTGIIITGHGTFASGIESNVRLLAGEREEIKVVDFLAGDSTDKLEQELQAALAEVKALPQCLIFCDILSGSPFQKAVMLTHTEPGIRVLYGTNTAMVIELCMRNMAGGADMAIDELAAELIQIGKDQIGTFCSDFAEDSIPEDGI